MAESIGDITVQVGIISAINVAEGALGAWAVTTVSAATGGVIGGVATIAEVALVLLYNKYVATSNNEKINLLKWQTLLFKTAVVLTSLTYCGITAPYIMTAIAVSTIVLPALTFYAIPN